MEFIMVLRWVLGTLSFFIAAPFAYFLAPVVSLYSVIKNDTAPRLFYYLLTPDNPLDGDKYHLRRWPNNSSWGKFLRRTAWQWRNVLYNFRYDLLGVDVCPAQARWYGDQSVNGEVSKKGWQLAIDENSNTFSFFAFLVYPGTRHGVRMYLGWKYKNGQRDTAVKRKMLSFCINPVWGG
ncbi:DUF7338 family protein [Rosenbergiella collisarenosi]|uniref:DUF7338 family protein n=2 Tax=Rosenbergiella collisarenosi TaxID=1544695 RepID=UPI001F4E9CD0|nr:hypothetical protein [Rosenbergiella collisarenosi]